MTIKKWSTHGKMPALGEQLPSSEDATPSNVEVGYETGVDPAGKGEDRTVNQTIEVDPEYVAPITSDRVAIVDAPTTPPKLGSQVNFVHDPQKVLVAKVIGVPWGKYRQLDLEATIPVESRERLNSLEGMGEQTPAVGTRRHYRATPPDEADELAAAQLDMQVEPTVEEVSVETGITYTEKLVRFPKVRWEARGERGRGVAGTWHMREEGE